MMHLHLSFLGKIDHTYCNENTQNTQGAQSAQNAQVIDGRDDGTTTRRGQGISGSIGSR